MLVGGARCRVIETGACELATCGGWCLSKVCTGWAELEGGAGQLCVCGFEVDAVACVCKKGFRAPRRT